MYTIFPKKPEILKLVKKCSHEYVYLQNILSLYIYILTLNKILNIGNSKKNLSSHIKLVHNILNS